MNVPAHYSLILNTIVVALVITGMVSGLLAMGYQFQMWTHRTAKANFAMRLLPWWPWIDGALTEEGVRSRKRYSAATAVFFICWGLMVVAIGSAALIWQR